MCLERRDVVPMVCFDNDVHFDTEDIQPFIYLEGPTGRINRNICI